MVAGTLTDRLLFQLLHFFLFATIFRISSKSVTVGITGAEGFLGGSLADDTNALTKVLPSSDQ